MATPHNFLAELVGCFATPVAENPTVAMIESAFRHHGMNARYINCEVQPAALADAARGARAMGWRRLQLLDSAQGGDHRPSRRARRFRGDDRRRQLRGAARRQMDRREHRRRRLHGIAEDADRRQGQVARRVRRRRRGARDRGRGGARRRAASRHRQSQPGARARTDRPRQRQDAGEGRVRPLGQRPIAPAARTTHSSTRLRSASIPISEVGPTPTSPPRNANAVVADVIPNPPRTLFLRHAEARGLRTLDGLGMLVNQGVVSIRHWFGVDVEASVMRRTLEELFGA